MATLNGTIAFAERNDIAVSVGNDLHFNVARIGHIAFEKDICIREIAPGFPGASLKGFFELIRCERNAKSASAATAGCLHGNGITVRVSPDACLINGRNRIGRARHDRHTRLHRDIPRGDFVTKRAHRCCRRSREGDARLNHAFRERGIFGKKTVAGMNDRGAGANRDIQNGRNIEIRERRAFRNPVGIVGRKHMARRFLTRSIDGNRSETKLTAGPDDPEGDFAAIGNQNTRRNGGTVGHPKPFPSTARFLARHQLNIRRY